jgi:hypothetical protein
VDSGARLVEACALLPVLHLPTGGKLTVACLGPQEEILAAEALRWPDITTAWVSSPPRLLRDRRLRVGTPPTRSCDALLISPGTDPAPILPALKPEGVANVSANEAHAGKLLASLRAIFPHVLPWREWLPEPLYGALCCADEEIVQHRQVPRGAKHLNRRYLPCLFAFGSGEVPLALPPHAKPALPPEQTEFCPE